MHAHFVNANIGGHATMHRHLRWALAPESRLRSTFFDVRPRLLGRLAAAPIPGLARLDLDFNPLRDQLTVAAAVRRHLDRLETPPDVLHLYTHNAALLSTGHMRAIPSVVSLDVTNRQNALRLPHRRPTRFTPTTAAPAIALERRVYEAARTVVTHSEWAASSVLEYGVPAGKIEVIPFGIAPGPRPDRVVDDAEPTILFVGTSMERKGGWRLLDVWRRLTGRPRLTLVTYEPVAAEPGLDVRNDIRPGDGRLEAVLAEADIYVMPSDIDAFGYSLLEAMAAALPVVAVGQAAVPELVADGSTGLLVPPGDDAALARAMQTLIDDPVARFEMGQAGRRRLEERFDARITTAALVAVLERALES